MSTVVFYKGPLGEMSGDWSVVTQHRHAEALYWARGWKQWLPYAEAEEKLILNKTLTQQGYSWNSRDSKKFAYIGPRIAAHNLGIGNILLEISKFPQERHVVKHKSWREWHDWLMISNIYNAFQRNYPDVKAPSPKRDPKNRPIINLNNTSSWTSIWKKDPATMLIKQGGIDTINGDTLYNALQPNTSRYYRVNKSSFKELDTFFYKFKELMQLQLQLHRSFSWPGLGTFWIEQCTNKKIHRSMTGTDFTFPVYNKLRFRASKHLRDILNGRKKIRKNFPFRGEQDAFKNLHYWNDCAQKSTFSRLRKLVYDFSEHTNQSKIESFDAIQIFTAVICANLVTRQRSYISHFGEFTVRKKGNQSSVHFREIQKRSLPLNIEETENDELWWERPLGLALNRPMDISLSKAWPLAWYASVEQTGLITYSSAGSMSAATARSLVELLRKKNHPFLNECMQQYLLHTLPISGKKLTATAKKIIAKFFQATVPTTTVKPKKKTPVKKATSSTAKTKGTKDRISGKKVVFTGQWTSGTRKEVIVKAKQLGVTSVSAVSSLVDYVAYGDKPGASKVKAANKHGIPLIDEKTWLTWCTEAKKVQTAKKSKKKK